MKFNLKNSIEFSTKNMLMKTLIKSSNNLRQLEAIELPVVVSFKLGKILKQVNEIFEKFEKKRIDKIKELGEEVKDDKGVGTNQFNVKKENLPEWEKYYEGLTSEEVTLKISPISLKELGDIKLPSSMFTNLDWLITE